MLELLADLCLLVVGATSAPSGLEQTSVREGAQRSGRLCKVCTMGFFKRLLSHYRRPRTPYNPFLSLIRVARDGLELMSTA